MTLVHAVVGAETPLRARWARWTGRLGRWRRRNGFRLPRPGWPGIVHQSWGWFDALPSPLAALVTGGAILFLLSTSMYLAGASVALREVGTAPGAATSAPVVNAAPTSTRIPTAGPPPTATPAGGVVLRSVVTFPASLRLRAQPSTTAATLQDLRAGTRLSVLEGSATADGFRWIRVRAPDGTVGWVIEDAVGGAAF